MILKIGGWLGAAWSAGVGCGVFVLGVGWCEAVVLAVRPGAGFAAGG